MEFILTLRCLIGKIFPFILARGRPTYNSEDKKNVISIETYLRGELSTYSLKTKKLFNKHIIKQKSNNINGSEINLLYMERAYSYKSLDEADEKLKNK
jgi:hypothetical protein